MNGPGPPRPPAAARADRRYLGTLCLFLLCVYLLTMAGRVISGDGEAMYQTTRAVLTERRLSIEPRPETAVGRGGNAYSKYGLGQSFAQAPFFLAGRLAAWMTRGDDDRATRFAAGITNGVLTTAQAAVFWLTLRAWRLARRPATAATLVYALGTIAWPYARSDFAEPLQALTLLTALYGLVRWRAQPSLGWAALAGFAAGFAVITKAASAVLLPPLALYFGAALWERYLRRRRPLAWTGRAAPAVSHLLAAALPFAACAVFQAALNVFRFGSVTEFGYGSEPRTGFTTPVVDGIGYLLVSSGKGLFWFAPPVILGLAGLPAMTRRLSLEAVTIALLFVAELLYYARWWAWHGDWSWGPRYMVVTVPFVMLAWGPLLSDPRPVLRPVLTLVAAGGMIVAFLGVAIDYGTYYSVVSAQVGRGVDVRAARVVPQFSPLLGHAWLLKASAYDVYAGLARGPGRDRTQNPFYRDYPWASSHPEHHPEAPERAFGFDFWFAALRQPPPFMEYWSALVACWLGATALVLGWRLWTVSGRSEVAVVEAADPVARPKYEAVPA